MPLLLWEGAECEVSQKTCQNPICSVLSGRKAMNRRAFSANGGILFVHSCFVFPLRINKNDEK